MKNNFETKIKAKISERSILNHPFYQKWNEGNLSIDELREYAKQYYSFVKNFPMFVSAVHSNCNNADIRRFLTENLADEEGYKTGIKDHPSLWLDFCNGLGLSKDDVINTLPHSQVSDAINEFYTLCRTPDYKKGIAALYGYESQIPEVSEIKIAGLNKFYNINDKESLSFFDIHSKADIEHSKAELDILLNNCKEEEQQEMLKYAEASANVYWKILDAVYVN